MLLKTVYQWDIGTQEDLAVFSEESEAIHRSASRALCRSDRYADPGQRRDEELANRPKIDRRRIRRRKVKQTEEKTGKKAKKSPSVQEKEANLISNKYPSREEFLARLASDLEHRKNREGDGYSIVVQAVMEHRDGVAIRAEFVETEGPRLAHLPNPNLGRILEKLRYTEWEDHYMILEELYMIEAPDGSIEIREGPCTFHSETIELLHQQCPNKKDIRLMQSLLIEDDDKYRAREYEEALEEIYLKEQRERLSGQLQDQAAKP